MAVIVRNIVLMSKLLATKVIRSQFGGISLNGNDDIFLDWATGWREKITQGLQITSKEWLVEVYLLEENYQLSNQNVNDDTNIEERL